MMIPSPWLNTQTRLWYIASDGPLYTMGEVHAIQWGGDVKATCAYCGTVITTPKCPHCGGNQTEQQAPSYLVEDAIAVLSAYLPAGDILALMPNGSNLEILHGCSGRPDDYDADSVILRLLDCQIQMRSMTNIMPGPWPDAPSSAFYPHAFEKPQTYLERLRAKSEQPRPTRRVDDCLRIVIVLNCRAQLLIEESWY